MKFNETLKIIGLMSGTSCDGLDIALIKISGFHEETIFKFIEGNTIPYSSSQRTLLTDFICSEKINLKEISQLNFYLPKIWSEMIIKFLDEIGIDRSEIDLIGSHGQTVWHQPESEEINNEQISSTLQIGDPSALAQFLGIPAVGDFRVADVAIGGQGAPLIPYFDWILFKNIGKNILSINIGGISNFTFIPKDGDINNVSAFDCGPGNVIIDAVMKKLYNKSKDDNGNIASSGKLSNELFDYIKFIDDFVELLPPKSTGREHYNVKLLNNIIKFAMDNSISSEDIIHTISTYTVYTIYKNYQLFMEDIYKIDEIVISGGGLYNVFIIRKLGEYFNDIDVKPITDYNIENDLKEAIGFAVLANETVKYQPSNIPKVTGAERPAILGKICLV